MDKEIKDEFENKYIAILGFGKEGKSTLNYIIQNVSSCKVCVLDKMNIDIQEYITKINKLNKDIQLTKQTNKKYLSNLEVFDYIVKTPGINIQDINSDKNLHKITSQTELFLKYYRGKTIGVTGTKGKSTTATLIYNLLKRKYNVKLIGNIGIPCFEVLQDEKNIDYFVFELSSHQLELVNYSPHIAIFLNIYEEHLDYYKTFESYIKAKRKIFMYQGKTDVYIYNKEQKDLINKDFKFTQTVYEISTDIKENIFKYEGQEINTLVGKHNIYNMIIAIEVAKLLKIDEKDILSALLEFKSLPHRLECFKELDGIKYIDDSISTIPEATISAINSFKKIGTLLIGGMDRHIDYAPLINFIKDIDVNKKEGIEVLNIIFMYDTGKRIYEQVKNFKLTNINIWYINNLEEATAKAKQLNKPGYVCMLSPAAASYGFFKNFEERGDKFKTYINM